MTGEAVVPQAEVKQFLEQPELGRDGPVEEVRRQTQLLQSSKSSNLYRNASTKEVPGEVEHCKEGKVEDRRRDQAMEVPPAEDQLHDTMLDPMAGDAGPIARVGVWVAPVGEGVLGVGGDAGHKGDEGSAFPRGPFKGGAGVGDRDKAELAQDEH